MTEQTTEAPPEESPAAQTPPVRKRIGVTIATPLRHFRGPEDLPEQIGKTLKELAARRSEHPFEFEFMAACGGLCSARNRLVHEHLKTGNDWLLWWDADLHDAQGTNADAVLRILSHKQPVVGALYCKRAKRPQWVANWITAAKIQGLGLLQVSELGGGFKAYHRKALTEIRRIFGDVPLANKKPTILYRERETGEFIAGFYQISVVEGDLLSEDYFLDFLSRCAGIPIIADTVVRLRQHDIDGNVYPEADWPPIPAEEHQ